MAINYRLVKRKDPNDPEGKERYFPKVVPCGFVGLQEIAEQIANKTEKPIEEVVLYIHYYLQELKVKLKKGEIVDFLGMGTLQHVKDDTVKEGDPDFVEKGIRSVFVQSEYMTKLMENAEFRRVE